VVFSLSRRCGCCHESKLRGRKVKLIISNEWYKRKKILKSNCLKSFDAKINGKVSGWIFCKTVYNHGGHQDNVFMEAHNFADWVVKFKKTDKSIYIILIDTDLTKELEDKSLEIDDDLIPYFDDMFINKKYKFNLYIYLKVKIDNNII
jgi:hypothetical protein